MTVWRFIAFRFTGLPVTFWLVFTDTDMANYIRGIKVGPFSSSFKGLTKPHPPEQNPTVKIPVGRALVQCKPQLKPGRKAQEVDVDALVDNL